MNKPKNERFYEKLTAHLAAYPDLTYMSEGDEPMQAVRLRHTDIANWPREINDADVRLIQQAAQSGQDGWAELAALFADGSKQEVVIRRPTSEQSVYDLYILCRFGIKWYVGLKVRATET